MNINDFLTEKFSHYPQTEEFLDLRESIENDLNNLINEKVAAGMDVEEAKRVALSTISELDELLKFIDGKQVDYNRAFKLYSQLFNSINKLELVNEFAVDLTNIDEIHLNFHIGNIVLIPNFEDKITVHEYMSRDIKNLFSTPTKIGNVLQIDQGPRKIVGIFRSRIEIGLPETFAGFTSLSTTSGNINLNNLKSASLFDITSKSGNVRLTNLNTERIQLDVTSGNIRIRDVLTNDLHANAKSGTIKLQNIKIEDRGTQLALSSKSGTIKLTDVKAPTTIITAASGNIKIDHLTTRYFDITANSGNIKAEKLSGLGKVSNKVGFINLEFDELLGDLTITEKNGNTKVSQPKNSNYHFELKTKNGALHLPDTARVTNFKSQKTIGQIGHLPQNTIKISSTNGSIKLI